MKIFTSTVLGSPAAECAHFGICQVEILPPDQWDSFHPQHIRHTKALLSLTRNQEQLRFEFPLSGMRTDTRESFFPVDGFRVDSAGQLPELLAVALGADCKVIVPKVYPLVFLTDVIVLDVELRKDLVVSEDYNHPSHQMNVNGGREHQGSPGTPLQFVNLRP
jgi:hypothetical protein